MANRDVVGGVVLDTPGADFSYEGPVERIYVSSSGEVGFYVDGHEMAVVNPGGGCVEVELGWEAKERISFTGPAGTVITVRGW